VAATDVDIALFDVQWPRLVAVDFNSGPEAVGNDIAWHCGGLGIYLFLALGSERGKGRKSVGAGGAGEGGRVEVLSGFQRVAEGGHLARERARAREGEDGRGGWRLVG
jgi:hypothetical protein